MKKAEYIKRIVEIMERCEDISLIDLIFQILTKCN